MSGEKLLTERIDEYLNSEKQDVGVAKDLLSMASAEIKTLKEQITKLRKIRAILSLAENLKRDF